MIKTKFLSTIVAVAALSVLGACVSKSAFAQSSPYQGTYTGGSITLPNSNVIPIDLSVSNTGMITGTAFGTDPVSGSIKNTGTTIFSFGPLGGTYKFAGTLTLSGGVLSGTLAEYYNNTYIGIATYHS